MYPTCIFREYRPEYERLRKTLVGIFNFYIPGQCILVSLLCTQLLLYWEDLTFRLRILLIVEKKSCSEAHHLIFLPGCGGAYLHKNKYVF